MSLNTEEYAKVALGSLDRILEEITLLRSGHTDVVNNVGIVRSALDEMGEIRRRNQELEKLVQMLKSKKKEEGPKK